MYHRVIDMPSVRGMTPALFERQLIYLRNHFRIVPMQTLVAELKTGNIQPYTLALTFDDGHFDFYAHAWPLLRKYKLPATLYITTGFVDGTHWLWPDLIKYLLTTHTLVGEGRDSIELQPLGQLSTSPTNIDETWNKIGDYCLTLPVVERNHFIQRLAQRLNVSFPSQPQSPFQAVTWDQLREMHREGLDIASHTMSHPLLSTLDSHSLHQELHMSANRIQQELGFMPLGICYPNGREEDISPAVIHQAQSLGYHYGVLARNYPSNAEHVFLLGRVSAQQDFTYFKWSLSRQQPITDQVPFDY